ncbi:hypothetical protein SteCoe_17548 [Stentor coeruleus]|uniref:Uncharacterized protein n=1 Tax=Stentor coeruleus TaxID=5963 RepID=A0A1R2BZ26_9CILI|nr:hypothetical protein SteCoe_17548 [Stentor coeruleus]
MNLYYADSFFFSKTFHASLSFSTIASISSTEKVSYILSLTGEVFWFSRISVPSSLNFPFRVVKISCGREHCALITENYEVYTWGNGETGALGLGSTTSYSNPQKVSISQDNPVTNVSCGAWHTLILARYQANNNFILVTGRGSEGQLGTGMTCRELLPKKVQISEEILDIYCGTNHSVVLCQSKSVYTSGDNRFGQLGLGHKRPCLSFTRVSLENVDAVSCGGHTASIVRGQVYAWGTGSFGELLVPTLLPGPISAKEIYVGDGIGCVIDNDNVLWLWGGRITEKKAVRAEFQVSCLSVSSGTHVFASTDPLLHKPLRLHSEIYSANNTPKAALLSPARDSSKTKILLERSNSKNLEKCLTEKKRIPQSPIGSERKNTGRSWTGDIDVGNIDEKNYKDLEVQVKAEVEKKIRKELTEQIKLDIENQVRTELMSKINKSLQEKDKEIEESFEKKDAEIQELQEELRKVLRDAQGLYEDNKKLRESVSKTTQEKERLVKSFKSDKDIKKYYEEHISDMEKSNKSNHEKMTQEINKLKSENDTMQELLAGIRQENNELCEKLITSQKKTSDLQSKYDFSQKITEELEVKIQTLQEQLNDLTSANHNLYVTLEKNITRGPNELVVEDKRMDTEGNKVEIDEQIQSNEDEIVVNRRGLSPQHQERLMKVAALKLKLNDLEDNPEDPLVLQASGSRSIRSQKRTFEDIRDKVKNLKKNRSTIQLHMQEFEKRYNK